MLISPVIEINEHEKTLLMLKLAVNDAISNDDSLVESEANSILAILKENVPVVIMPSLIVKKKVIKKVVLKKIIAEKVVKKAKVYVAKKKEDISSQKSISFIEAKKRGVVLGEEDDLSHNSEKPPLFRGWMKA